METHITTTPNKKPSGMDIIRKDLENEEFAKTVLAHYQGNGEAAISFKMSCIDYIRATPKLLECDRMSLLSAFVTVAQFKFMPSKVSGEAYVIPYGKEAKFQLGYQGIVTLLYRSPKISNITANIIHKNDLFEYEEGLDARLVHKPALFGNGRGDAIGVYTIVTMADGTKTFKVMDKSAVMSIKDLSKAKNVADSPWNSKDPELWMWKKTCLIQHSKLLPKTQEIQKALEKDFDGEGLDRPSLNAEGPATGAASHGVDKVVAEPACSPYNEPEVN